MNEKTFPIVEAPEPSRQQPVVVSIPHSGTIIPADERQWYAADIEELQRGGDSLVDELYRGAHAFGATVVRTPFSRFVIDLNRLPDDFSPLSVSGARIRRDPGYYGHRGLIWAVTTDGKPIYRTPMPRSVVQRRLEKYYRPYHQAVSEKLQELRDQFGYAILLDAHSMPSHSSASGGSLVSRRADIVPGDLMGRSCGRWLSDGVIDYWSGVGRTVSRNRPYRGGAITRRHHLPAKGIHAIQIELNRDLYLDEAADERSEGFARLRSECLQFVAQVTRLEPSSAHASAAE